MGIGVTEMRECMRGRLVRLDGPSIRTLHVNLDDALNEASDQDVEVTRISGTHRCMTFAFSHCPVNCPARFRQRDRPQRGSSDRSTARGSNDFMLLAVLDRLVWTLHEVAGMNGRCCARSSNIVMSEFCESQHRRPSLGGM